jgi:hypothetical protein
MNSEIKSFTSRSSFNILELLSNYQVFRGRVVIGDSMIVRNKGTPLFAHNLYL